VPNLPQDLPLWAIKLLAALAGLGLVAVFGLVIARLFRRLTDRRHLE
jgi:hypothetical protein